MKKSAEQVIKRLMEAYATTDEVTLSVKLNRDIGTLRTWKSRDLVPLSVLVEAARATDYSVEWLRGDSGAAKRANKKTPADDREAFHLTEEESTLVKRYRELPDRLRAHVNDAALLAVLAYRDRAEYHEGEAAIAKL